MIKTQISLTHYQHKTLRTLATEDNTSMSEHIRRALDMYFELLQDKTVDGSVKQNILNGRHAEKLFKIRG